MSGPTRPGDSISAASIVAELAAIETDAERRAARMRHRGEALAFRLQARHAQGLMRLADALAKFGGGSLLTATVLLIVNGQTTWPVVVTAVLALLVFAAATISLVRIDHRIAEFDHAADLIEAALQEANR